jgi:ribulose-5-phosphate 4-epimerase/fuculose-1-phosphate aldolase
MRAVLIAGHAPFCWGTRAADAEPVDWKLEAAGQMAFSGLTINPEAQPLFDGLREKQFIAQTRRGCLLRAKNAEKEKRLNSKHA